MFFSSREDFCDSEKSAENIKKKVEMNEWMKIMKNVLLFSALLLLILMMMI